jgi:hypothetical protein
MVVVLPAARLMRTRSTVLPLESVKASVSATLPRPLGRTRAVNLNRPMLRLSTVPGRLPEPGSGTYGTPCLAARCFSAGPAVAGQRAPPSPV